MSKKLLRSVVFTKTVNRARNIVLWSVPFCFSNAIRAVKLLSYPGSVYPKPSATSPADRCHGIRYVEVVLMNYLLVPLFLTSCFGTWRFSRRWGWLRWLCLLGQYVKNEALPAEVACVTRNYGYRWTLQD